MHGKTTSVSHLGDGLFAGLPNPLVVMRYHSLVVSAQDFPDELEMTAWSIDRPRGEEIMALRHRRHPVFGVQFHPESIATESGKALLKNFLDLAATFRDEGRAAVA
jgi:anthranilate synthase/aminodeoxychorismate synthase-like glutamine amidotransferase